MLDNERWTKRLPQANLTAQQLGVGWATAEACNRFSINTPAMLFNHAGNGSEATFNKNAPPMMQPSPSRPASPPAR